jgi:hypothetical protein
VAQITAEDIREVKMQNKTFDGAALERASKG